MAAPPRGNGGHGCYFITASTFQCNKLLQSERIARLFVNVLLHHRQQGKYLLHEFVVMPDHFHLLVTPLEPLDAAIQLIRDGFSRRMKEELGFEGEVWQTDYYDRRVRGMKEYAELRQYIRQNPVQKKMAAREDEFPFSSAVAEFVPDEIPQRLRPVDLSA
jgi:putative transposase